MPYYTNILCILENMQKVQNFKTWGKDEKNNFQFKSLNFKCQIVIYFFTIGNSGHPIPLRFTMKNIVVNCLLANFEKWWLTSPI